MFVRLDQHPSHCGRGRPESALIGAAVRQLAVRPISISEFFEYRQDLRALFGQQAVHRLPTGGVIIQFIVTCTNPPTVIAAPG